jgi:rhodanese-related sulfurtransferase
MHRAAGAPFFQHSVNTMKTLTLIPLFACLLAAPLLAADKPPVPPAVKNVGVAEFDKLRADKKNVVLDVRTAEEFAKGHIPGAINVDFNAPDFQKKVAELDKSKTYLVHCAGGVRSAKACTLMDKSAFTNLFNLDPGFRAWEKAGKPVEKK